MKSTRVQRPARRQIGRWFSVSGYGINDAVMNEVKIIPESKSGSFLTGLKSSPAKKMNLGLDLQAE